MRIYLIGMPGCGKSTLGKILAKELNYDFIDMDVYIEQKACMFIDEIFDAYGENHFRALERNILEELTTTRDNVVIATGGGIIKNKENKKLMNGLCVYLEVSVCELEKRVSDSECVRPLLKEKSITRLYEERKMLYDEFADIIVDNTDMKKAILKIKEAI